MTLSYTDGISAMNIYTILNVSRQQVNVEEVFALKIKTGADKRNVLSIVSNKGLVSIVEVNKDLHWRIYSDIHYHPECVI